MKRVVALIVLFVILSCSVCIPAEKNDKAMLELRAQLLAERILRLKMQNDIIVSEHNKAVREFQAIMKILEQMDGGNKS